MGSADWPADIEEEKRFFKLENAAGCQRKRRVYTVKRSRKYIEMPIFNTPACMPTKASSVQRVIMLPAYLQHMRNNDI